ncbi:chemotaxis protein CheW [Pseudomonas aeruginosa]|uniref:chemotaxis protein CheW n=1 Tax=Pseudomonas aeruginosa TaxID=287 RepID=UPI0009A4805B|nr:chemotaxis protein CheW [Pseudomonas aeruginosa]
MKQKQETVKAWFGSGSPWVWMNAGAVSIAVIMTIGLLAVIAVRGLGHFWPANVIEATYQIPGEAAKTVIGEVVQAEEVPRARLRSAGMPVPEAGPEFMTRELLKLGNRELYGSDFSWVVGEWLQDIKRPEALMVLERREWGNFYGYLLSVKENGQVVAEGDAAVGELQKRMQRVDDLYAKLYKLEKGDIGGINHGLERLRLKERKLQLDGKLDAAAQADLAAERSELQARYKVLEEQLNGLHQEFNRDSVVMRDASGRESEITLGKLVHAYQPNAMGLGTKMTVYFKKLWEFLSDDPREANTEGGIFPAIFGTVMMTLVMALIVTPFGVIAAVYLREYAKQGPLTRVIRIAVNNLAGVPAIVYGVFGLGFFVYVLGGSIDRLFFPEALPAPTFGTPGLFWASLTLAILDGLIVAVEAVNYVIPLTYIVESLQARSDDVRGLGGEDNAMIRVRGEYLPLFSLHELLRIGGEAPAPEQGIVVILESEGRSFALQVDELVGQQQVVIKSLEQNFRRVEGIAGATIMGDGSVALILDVDALPRLAAREDTADERH